MLSRLSRCYRIFISTTAVLPHPKMNVTASVGNLQQQFQVGHHEKVLYWGSPSHYQHIGTFKLVVRCSVHAVHRCLIYTPLGAAAILKDAITAVIASSVARVNPEPWTLFSTFSPARCFQHSGGATRRRLTEKLCFKSRLLTQCFWLKYHACYLAKTIVSR